MLRWQGVDAWLAAGFDKPGNFMQIIHHRGDLGSSANSKDSLSIERFSGTQTGTVSGSVSLVDLEP